MEDNNFQGIKSNMFTGLIKLKYLSLSNSFTSLRTLTNETFVSLAHSPLLILNLTKNKISKIESGAFSWLGHLKVLDLGLNEIGQELTGEEWRGLENIVEIYLSYNKLLQLTSNSFVLVPSLQQLMLRRVALQNLDSSPSPFHPLHNLTILYLSNNNIANIDTVTSLPTSLFPKSLLIFVTLKSFYSVPGSISISCFIISCIISFNSPNDSMKWI